MLISKSYQPLRVTDGKQYTLLTYINTLCIPITSYLKCCQLLFHYIKNEIIKLYTTLNGMY